MTRIAAMTALLLAFPVAVAAQGEQERHREGMGEHRMENRGQRPGMGMGMMGMREAVHAHPGPGMMLRAAEELGLSEDQVERLEAMHESAHAAMDEHHEAADAARERAHEAMMADTPDLDAFQAALEEAAMHDVAATVAMARVHMEAGQVLTEEQRAALTEMAEEMHGEGMGEGMQERRRMHSGR